MNVFVWGGLLDATRHTLKWKHIESPITHLID